MKPLRPDRLGLINPKTGRFVNPEFQEVFERAMNEGKNAGLTIILELLIIMIGLTISDWLGRIMGIPAPPPVELGEK